MGRIWVAILGSLVRGGSGIGAGGELVRGVYEWVVVEVFCCWGFVGKLCGIYFKGKENWGIDSIW